KRGVRVYNRGHLPYNCATFNGFPGEHRDVAPRFRVACMKIQHVSGPILEQSADLLALIVGDNLRKDPLFKEADEALEGLLGQLAAGEGFEGKSGQSLSLVCAGYL